MDNKELSPIIYNRDDITDLNKEILYRGFFTLERVRFRHRKFDGSMSDEVSREIMRRGNAVALLAYDAKRDTVVLVEQIRIVAMETDNYSPWMIELIAGMVDKKDENLEKTVRREAKEEAGITIGRCQLLMSYLPSSGGLAEKLFLFVGEVDSMTAKGTHGIPSENEDIKVHVVSRDLAFNWVKNGIISNAASIIALQWLQLNHIDLKAAWCD